MTTLAERVEAADGDALGYWCQPCRETGMLHCSEVEYCGYMARLPYSERAKRYAALRARESKP